MIVLVELKCVVFKGVASQRQRASLNVGFCVATTFTKREQLHQFARQILIGA